jgi:hypothetical protein
VVEHVPSKLKALINAQTTRNTHQKQNNNNNKKKPIILNWIQNVIIEFMSVSNFLH